MIPDRVGRRGAFLSFLAILDFAYGYSLIAEPLPGRARLNLLLPYPVWGYIWIAVGAVCAVGVFMQRDRLSFSVAAMLKFAWAVLFTDVWLISHVPRGWVAVVIWLAFGTVVLVVSGWPEPLLPEKKLPKP